MRNRKLAFLPFKPILVQQGKPTITYTEYRKKTVLAKLEPKNNVLWKQKTARKTQSNMVIHMASFGKLN